MVHSTNLDGSSARPYLLPADLPKALTGLSSDELETLLNAVQSEQKRRSVSADSQSTTYSANQKSDPNPGRPRIGKVNAIRAALKAGVTPATVARQFGVTKAIVAEVAASRQS